MDTKNNNAHHSKEERCDICGNILTKGLCSNCGWAQIVFPNTVPPEIKDFNTQRKETAIKIYKEGCVSKTTIEKFKKNYEAESSKNKTLEHNLNDAKAKIAAAEQEKGRLKGQVDKAQKELDFAKKEMQGLVDKVQSLTAQNKMLENDKNILLIEFEKTKKSNQLLGIVLVTDTKNDFHAVAPINSGVNTFGSEVSNGNHHMVRLGPFSIQLGPKHFSVEPIGKHLLLRDMTGGSMNLPPLGMYVEGKTIRLNNSIEIKFIKIL